MNQKQQLVQNGWSIEKAQTRKRETVAGYRAFIRRQPAHTRYSYRVLLVRQYLWIRAVIRTLQN